MNEIVIPYGKGFFSLEIPPDVNLRTLSPRQMEPLKAPRDDLFHAIENPISGPSLRELTSRIKNGIFIICSDHTRSDRKEEMLPWLIEMLNEYGIASEDITIMVAFGSHACVPDEKIRQITGKIPANVRVIGHDINAPMIDRGTTRAGTPVRVNASLADARLIILVSAVVHHYFAGYGGGRKLIIPGLASKEAINANHSLVWENPKEAVGGRHPNAKAGILDGNPVHEDMLDTARLALGDTPAFSINTVLSSDKQFGFFVAGELDASHRAAVVFTDAHFTVAIDEPADIVIASAGGSPKDLNIIQAHKGLDNAVRALKPSGTLLYFMACPEGTGSPVISEYASYSLEEIRARLAREYEVYGQTTHAIKEKTARFKVIAVSDADSGLLAKLGFQKAGNAIEAIDMLRDELRSAGLVYVIPWSDITLPKTR